MRVSLVWLSYRTPFKVKNDDSKDKLKCPHCKSVISNIKKLVLYKNYKCTKCEKVYFLIRSPQYSYVSNS